MTFLQKEFGAPMEMLVSWLEEGKKPPTYPFERNVLRFPKQCSHAFSTCSIIPQFYVQVFV